MQRRPWANRVAGCLPARGNRGTGSNADGGSLAEDAGEGTIRGPSPMLPEGLGSGGWLHICFVLLVWTLPEDEPTRPRIGASTPSRGHLCAVGLESVFDDIDKLPVLAGLALPPDLYGDMLPAVITRSRQRTAMEMLDELRRHPEATRSTYAEPGSFKGSSASSVSGEIRASGAEDGTTITGKRLEWMTSSATWPNRQRPKPSRPWVVITIRFA